MKHEKKKILVLGPDEYNKHELTHIDNYEKYEFKFMVHVDEVLNKEEIEIQNIEREIENVLSKNRFDGIICFYDFPYTLLGQYFTDREKLPGPSLLSDIKCEHKYWSRVEQEKVIPEYCPDYEAIDINNPKKFTSIKLEKPFWLKPIKAHSSKLGDKISNEEDYKNTLDKMQEGISYFADPFNYMLNKADLPPEIKKVDGYHCLAEEIISGHQCTISGYVYNQEVYFYGLVDSLHYEEAPSFLCYMLPSRLPETVQKEIEIASRKIMKQIGFNNSAFNIEYFYNEEENKLSLLEINPRFSPSHSYLYDKVKGKSNHQVIVKLSLGEKPDFVSRKGKYNVAAKFQHRVFYDGIVEKTPDKTKIKELEKSYPGSRIHITINEGDKLSDLMIDDAYSYCIAELYMANQDRDLLFEKFNNLKSDLGIKIRKL